jgi:hypothetical protein
MNYITITNALLRFTISDRLNHFDEYICDGKKDDAVALRAKSVMNFVKTKIKPTV